MEVVEKPLAKILTEMEKTGALLDAGYLKKLSEEKHKELNGLEKKIWKLAGGDFNINSPKQMGEVLFVKLGLGGAKPKKTATGAYSTNVSQLIKLKGTHPIIGELMEYREISKLVSTYIDALPKLADKENRLHTHLILSERPPAGFLRKIRICKTFPKNRKGQRSAAGVYRR